mmetsp:Transcript_4805/g.19216  ORF Transcript_4805/g.19216 Transcript_4805/m.19216 type:complete len:372 (-) Transcript_4805:41-1156(-)
MSMAKNSAGAFVLSSAPASAPIACPLSKDHSPSRDVSRISLPSRDAIRPRNSSLSPTLCACAAMGVRQEPSSAARNARSHSTPMRVSSWFSSARNPSCFSSPVRHAIPMAPCATAGSITSVSRILVACCVMSMRFRPAIASSVQSTTPSWSLRMRDCTFPRKFTHSRVGNLFRSCDWRRSDAVPTSAPSGSSDRSSYLTEMNASRTSSRGSMQGRMVPSGRYVGTSFMECTAMSMRPSRSATSSSRVNRPLPPMSARGWSRTLSPVVLMMQISSAPSSASSGKFFLRRSRVMYAWARARGLPRVPILTMGSSTSATTRMAPRDLTEALTRLAALGIAAEKEEERALIFLPDAAGATRAETAAADIMAAIVM